MTNIQRDIAACINAPQGVSYVSRSSLLKFAGWLRDGTATLDDFREVGGDALATIAKNAADVCPSHD